MRGRALLATLRELLAAEEEVERPAPPVDPYYRKACHPFPSWSAFIAAGKRGEFKLVKLGRTYVALRVDVDRAIAERPAVVAKKKAPRATAANDTAGDELAELRAMGVEFRRRA